MMRLNVVLLLMGLMSTTLMRSALSCPTPVCVCKWKGGKQTVECGDARLASIPDGMDAGTQVLNFTGNNLSQLTSERFLLLELTNLQKIFLCRNKLTRIFDRAFKGLSNLVELDLSENRLTSIPTQTFPDYSSLMRLSLSHNSITELKANAFRQLNFLTTLELSNNQIAAIEDDAFRGMDNLEWLRLDGNRISTFRGHNALPTSLHGINLHGNWWNCDCNMVDFRMWLTTFNIPQQIDDPKCVHPKRLVRQVIRLLDVQEFACLPEIKPSVQYLELAEGQNASLRCKINAKPEATISWWFHGQLLQNDSISDPSLQLTYYIEEGNEQKTSELFLFNINAAYNGTFACVAENLAGRSFANYTIRIILKVEERHQQELDFFMSNNFFFIIYGAGAGAFIIVLILCCLILRCIKRSNKLKLRKDSSKGSEIKLQNSKCSSIMSELHAQVPIIRENGLVEQQEMTQRRHNVASDNQNGLLNNARQAANPDVINVAKVNNGTLPNGLQGTFSQNVYHQLRTSNQRFDSLETIPRGILKQIYHHQVDVHLNPRCFLRPAGYPIEYRLHHPGGDVPATQSVVQETVSNQLNYYRTLPHKSKVPANGPKFSMEAEFLSSTPFFDGFTLQDIRYTAEGYPTQRQQQIHGDQSVQRVWPPCLPGYQQHTLVRPAKSSNCLSLLANDAEVNDDAENSKTSDTEMQSENLIIAESEMC